MNKEELLSPPGHCEKTVEDDGDQAHRRYAVMQAVVASFRAPKASEVIAHTLSALVSGAFFFPTLLHRRDSDFP